MAHGSGSFHRPSGNVAKKSSAALVGDVFAPDDGAVAGEVVTCGTSTTAVPCPNTDPEVAGWDVAVVPAWPEAPRPPRTSEAATPDGSVAGPAAAASIALTAGTSLLPVRPGVASSKAPPPPVRAAPNATCPRSLR